jgi:hypothetical protein
MLSEMRGMGHLASTNRFRADVGSRQPIAAAGELVVD